MLLCSPSPETMIQREPQSELVLTYADDSLAGLQSKAPSPFKPLF